MFPGMRLLPGEYCNQTNRSWEGIPLIIRQLVYIARKIGELQGGKDKANDTLDLITGSSDYQIAETRLRGRYCGASILLDEQLAANMAPSLKISGTKHHQVT
ncbi:MAG: hypothetical protein HC836_47065 [Richelia sp. RM2_1_2]|nr:hypothetical protein [Richelia sp. RM2_1_2]